MTVPEVTKNWTYRSNVIVPNDGTVLGACRSTMMAIKNEMVTNFGWTVTRSSNKSTVADSDLWVNLTDLNWAGITATRSWAVLTNPLGFQFVLDCATSSTNYYWQGRIGFSEGGLFTGGTTAAIPTATDNLWLIGSAVSNFLTINSSARRVLHMWQTQDFKQFRLIQMANTNVYSSIILDTLDEPHSSFNGILGHAEGGTNHLTYANFHRSTTRLLARRTDGVELPSVYSCQGMLATGVGERWFVPSIDGDMPFTELRAYSPTVNYYTRLGRVPDLWLGSVAGASNGDTYSDSQGNVRKFIQFNHMIFPWDGSMPEIA